MAELSACGDKFDAWASEPAATPPNKRPPLGGRPPVMGGRGKAGGRQLGPVTGSARASSTSKRIGLV